MKMVHFGLIYGRVTTTTLATVSGKDSTLMFLSMQQASAPENILLFYIRYFLAVRRQPYKS